MTIHVGDCRQVLATLPEKAVQCVVTSPPYWGLRDYKVGDAGIGLEKTFDAWLAAMVEVFRGVRRVLRDDGTVWLNIGDAYAATTKGSGGHSAKQDSNAGSRFADCRATIPSGLRQKDMLGMPWRLAFALQADGWFLRSDIIWHKPNPMPESVTDRPTKSHEYVFLLTKKNRYFYDAEAVREKHQDPIREQNRPSRIENMKKAVMHGYSTYHIAEGQPSMLRPMAGHPNGRNLRSVWSIPTQSFRGTHFATYPEKLVATCLKAGTSSKGCCVACGAPWVRVIERQRVPTRPGENTKIKTPGANSRMFKERDPNHSGEYKTDRAALEIGNRDPERHVAETRTTGWKAGCRCEAGIVPCVVLDPFNGSGTTGVVCKRMGLNYLGIELNPEYADMARRRIAHPDEFGAEDVADVAQGVLF